MDGVFGTDRRMHRVAVLADGFAWNGNTYASLSKVAFASSCMNFWRFRTVDMMIRSIVSHNS